MKPFTILPNTCANCGDGPLTTVYAANPDQANAGAGLCAKCTGVEPVKIIGTPPSSKAITEMTKAELLTVAKSMQIEASDSMTKAQLLDLIAAATES